MPVPFTTLSIVSGLYRPFTPSIHYYDSYTPPLSNAPDFSASRNAAEPSHLFYCNGVANKPFHALATDKLPDLHLAGDTQCLPLYRYTADGEQVSNITEWGLRQFREHYGDDGISAEDIFAYTYAMLHDPAYRERYEVDLRREFPRVYFQDDFAWWAQQGQQLLDLHI